MKLSFCFACLSAFVPATAVYLSESDNNVETTSSSTIFSGGSGRDFPHCLSKTSKEVLLPAVVVVVLSIWTARRHVESWGAKLVVADGMERSPFIDNAKFLLMVLIVWTNALEILMSGSLGSTESQLEGHGRGTIVAVWFHFPAMACLSGMLWQPCNRQRCRGFLVMVVAPLVAGILVVPVIMRLIDDKTLLPPYNDAFAHPFRNGYLGQGPGHLWYLRCLIVWRWKAHLLSGKTPRTQLIVSFVAGTLSSCFHDLLPKCLDDPTGPHFGPFCFVRATTLYPFFACGQHLPWQSILGKTGRFPMLSCLLCWSCIALLCYAMESQLFGAQLSGIMSELEARPRPFVNMHKKADLACPFPYDSAAIPARYILGLSVRMIQLVAFFCFGVPRYRTAYSDFGRVSMYPYLLHPLIVSALVVWTTNIPHWFPDMPRLHGEFLMIAWLLASVPITAFCASTPVQSALECLVSPFWLDKCLYRLGLDDPIQ